MTVYKASGGLDMTVSGSQSSPRWSADDSGCVPWVRSSDQIYHEGNEISEMTFFRYLGKRAFHVQ